MSTLQPLAYIHPSAKIADNVVIDPFVTIAADLHIGEIGRASGRDRV